MVETKPIAIDAFSPVWEFGEFHQVQVRAAPERVHRALEALLPGDVPLVGLLMALRSLRPRALADALRPAAQTPLPILAALQRRGFVLLSERRGQEVVLGLIGRFWQPSSGLRPVPDAAAFLAFDDPSYARAGRAATLRPLLGGDLPGQCPDPPAVVAGRQAARGGKRMSELSIHAGGVFAIGVAIFHLCFWRLFRWREELPRLSHVNRQAMQVMNLCLTSVFLGMAWVSFVHTAALIATPLGRCLLAAFAAFWLLRALYQPLFFGWRSRSSIRATALAAAAGGLYLVPLLQ